MPAQSAIVVWVSVITGTTLFADLVTTEIASKDRMGIPMRTLGILASGHVAYFTRLRV